MKFHRNVVRLKLAIRLSFLSVKRWFQGQRHFLKESPNFCIAHEYACKCTEADTLPSIELQLNCRYHKSMIQPVYIVHTLQAFQRLSPGYVSEATSYRFRRG